MRLLYTCAFKTGVTAFTAALEAQGAVVVPSDVGLMAHMEELLPCLDVACGRNGEGILLEVAFHVRVRVLARVIEHAAPGPSRPRLVWPLHTNVRRLADAWF